MDLIAHLHRQAAFSKATFGPGPRTKGVTDHIKKELDEVAKCYDGSLTAFVGTKANMDTGEMEDITRPADTYEQHEAAAEEWVDVAILGLDGLLRALAAANPGETFEEVADTAAYLIAAKQCKNEMREWPDWRTASEDDAIEHKRGVHD